MSNVALSNIKYGAPDGTLVIIPFGADVAELPQDTIDELTALGLIGPSTTATDEVLADETAKDAEAAAEAEAERVRQEAEDAQKLADEEAAAKALADINAAAALAEAAAANTPPAGN